MERRTFLRRSGLVGVAGLATLDPRSAEAKPGKKATSLRTSADTIRTWHFHDRWRLDQFDQLAFKQGEPQWQREALYIEPNMGPLSAWPTVHHDQESGRYRMWYSANWKPLQLMVADSEDGRNWSPVFQPLIRPLGNKLAPHHLFTLPGGSGGSVYVDPIAADGFPYKMFVHQRGNEVLKRAQSDAKHRWHEIAQAEGAKKYIVDDFTLVSRDGLHWQTRFDMQWSSFDWHPEPPIFGFYNRHTARHAMTVRPGWGDRRQCIQTTHDFTNWSGPELLLQPDAMDDELIEFYGMPVFPYGDGYVGLPWVFHSQSSDPNHGFNRFVGPVDCQLAFSTDGNRFIRGLRKPFIRRNGPEEHGGGAIQPSSMVETDDELLFYSAATRLPHGRGSEARKLGMTDNASILLHTLRKDGLMYIESSGDWGRLITRPLVLLDSTLFMNAAAPTGEVVIQLTDLESRPIEGFTFEEFLPLKFDDQLQFPLRWSSASIQSLVGRIIRVEVRLRHARLYAVRGHLHFIDAQDRWLIEDGKPLPIT